MRGFWVAALVAMTSAMTQSAWAQTEERWFCVATLATGFSFNDQTKKWVQTNFNVDDSKYILAKDEFGNYVFTEVGENYGNPCSPKSEYGVFYCDGLVEKITLNTISRRFLSSYHFGYFNGEDNNNNTPHLVIGVCSPL